MTFSSVGCTSAPASNPSSARQSAPAPRTAETPTIAETFEQKDAQRVWCEYLDALHRRAAAPTAGMPSFQKCLEARTYAAPKMLRQTAQCSREALSQFEGDPFTKAYAATVVRCGSEALDACEVQPKELEPFISLICANVDRCGEVDIPDCSTMVDARFSVHLSRALGAMNGRGRDAFRTCLKKLSCGDVGEQIVECIDPIMTGLLWLPE